MLNLNLLFLFFLKNQKHLTSECRKRYNLAISKGVIAMKKVLIIIGAALLVAAGGVKVGLSPHQAIVASVFSVSIIGVLLFWELRLSFVFFGAGLMLVTRSIDLENLIKFASLDVILFLIGTMILVGMLNDAGFFYWVVTRLIRIKNITGEKLFILLMLISGVLSGLMGEVASIIIMVKIILDICHLIDIEPAPSSSPLFWPRT